MPAFHSDWQRGHARFRIIGESIYVQRDYDGLDEWMALQTHRYHCECNEAILLKRDNFVVTLFVMTTITIGDCFVPRPVRILAMAITLCSSTI